MIPKSLLILLIVGSALVHSSCTSEEVTKKRTDITSESNVILDEYQLDIDSVTLVKEVTFESTKEVFFDGLIKDFAVDSFGRVFIGISKTGRAKVLVFNPDGKFITELGRKGRGPGEFEGIASISLANNQLGILDPILQKVILYSLDDFSHIRDELIEKSHEDTNDSFFKLMSANRLFLTKEGFFIEFRVNIINDLNKFSSSRVYKLFKKGTVSEEYIIELDRFKFYHFPKNRNKNFKFRLGFTPPFAGESLIFISEDAEIYKTWNEENKIEIFTETGELDTIIHLPFNKSKFELDKTKLTTSRTDAIKEQGMPETWPLTHTFTVDDEKRIWIATITKSDSLFTWYVLDRKGRVNAKFAFKGERWNRSAFSGNMNNLLRNNYFYDIERDKYGENHKLVKYKILLNKR